MITSVSRLNVCVYPATLNKLTKAIEEIKRGRGRSMFDNPVKPHAQKIPDVLPKPEMEWTFRVANDIPVRHG